MVVILYRWRIKSGMEDQFRSAWAEITSYYLRNFDSLGSRLHYGKDGIWYAYAQWNSIDDRNRAFFERNHIQTGSSMTAAIEERFPEIELEVVEDMLKTGE